MDNPTMHEDLHMPVEQAPDGLEDAYEILMQHKPTIQEHGEPHPHPDMIITDDDNRQF